MKTLRTSWSMLGGRSREPGLAVILRWHLDTGCGSTAIMGKAHDLFGTGANVS